MLCAAAHGSGVPTLEVNLSPQAAAAWRASDGATGCLPADVMLQQQHWGSSEWQSDQYNAQSLQEAAAGSVAARGLCFANTHPAPTRFLPLKKPGVFMVQRAARANQAALQESLWSNTGRLGFRCVETSIRPVTTVLPPALCHLPTVFRRIGPGCASTVFPSPLCLTS